MIPDKEIDQIIADAQSDLQSSIENESTADLISISKQTGPDVAIDTPESLEFDKRMGDKLQLFYSIAKEHTDISTEEASLVFLSYILLVLATRFEKELEKNSK